MTKSYIVLALLAAPLLAVPAAAETITGDGFAYVYTVEQQGHTRIIAGHDSATGRPFRLRVAHGWVQGEFNGKPVQFNVRDAKGAASRQSVAISGTAIASR